ncbi:MAG: GPW/gp25 family protein [Bacteroidota bacterium]
MPKYYTQPLNFSLLMQGKEHPGCSLKDSIAQRIHLILITNLGEFRSDKEFGNKMWDHDFEIIPNINAWKDSMAKSVREAIIKFEQRLLNIKVTLDLTEEEFTNKEQQSLKRIKKKVDIKIQANIKKTNEQFYFQELLYVSPLWID